MERSAFPFFGRTELVSSSGGREWAQEEPDVESLSNVSCWAALHSVAACTAVLYHPGHDNRGQTKLQRDKQNFGDNEGVTRGGRRRSFGTRNGQ